MRALHPIAPIGLMVCTVLVFGNADAYDLRTHGSISDRSFDASQGTARYLNEMGIGPDDVFDRPAVTPPGQLADFTNLGTVRGWLTEGAIREDDYQPHPLLERIFGCEPPLNPPSAIDRPVHHFFDVQRGGAARKNRPSRVGEGSLRERARALARQSHGAHRAGKFGPSRRRSRSG